MLVTIISIVLMMAITLSLFITKWLQNTALVQFLLKLTAFVPYLGSFLQKVDLSQSVAYWSNSKLFFAILMVIYFTFLFRYLFNKNIGYKDSFWGGLFFCSVI